MCIHKHWVLGIPVLHVLIEYGYEYIRIYIYIFWVPWSYFEAIFRAVDFCYQQKNARNEKFKKKEYFIYVYILFLRAVDVYTCMWIWNIFTCTCMYTTTWIQPSMCNSNERSVLQCVLQCVLPCVLPYICTTYICPLLLTFCIWTTHIRHTFWQHKSIHSNICYMCTPYICQHKYIQDIYVHSWSHTYIYMHVDMYMHMNSYAYIDVWRTHVSAHTHTYKSNLHIWLYMQNTCVHIHVCKTHVSAHTHTKTNRMFTYIYICKTHVSTFMHKENVCPHTHTHVQIECSHIIFVCKTHVSTFMYIKHMCPHTHTHTHTQI